ncbi:MAG TPA: hypothetical protein VFW96_14015 [Thermomicrobiales bacterium]|nr:hypothetical protein [Thermomicrobiales bacterium]
MSTMFDRTAQVNAHFAGGTGPPPGVVEELRALGLGAEQIKIIARADPGAWRAPEPTTGVLARLRGILGGAREAAAPPPTPDLLLLVYLGADAALAEPVQEVLRRGGATRVDYHPAGRMPTSALERSGAMSDADAVQFRAAFPDAEQRHGPGGTLLPRGADAPGREGRA